MKETDPRGDEVDEVVLIGIVELVDVVLPLSDVNVAVETDVAVVLRWS